MHVKRWKGGIPERQKKRPKAVVETKESSKGLYIKKYILHMQLSKRLLFDRKIKGPIGKTMQANLKELYTNKQYQR